MKLISNNPLKLAAVVNRRIRALPRSGRSPIHNENMITLM
jgi:hypothetical protein